MKSQTLLAIESSCDDTAAAVFVDDVLKSNVVSSQRIHSGFGGVVPELASRAHQRLIVPVVQTAFEEAGVSQNNLDVVAVTYGPGLAGSLLVGLSFAKALALSLHIPLVGVNHMEGHIYSVFIEGKSPPFPFLCLTVSGGHTELTVVKEGFQHQKLGKTRDDAAGEAFDKVAKLLSLGYPGGPKIDQLAQQGDASFYQFPRTKVDGFDFSFSGLKTSVLYYLSKKTDSEREILLKNHLADICASFQQAVVDILLEAVSYAIQETGIMDVAVVGGVSANSGLRKGIQELGKKMNVETYIPPLKYCMDNAAMIGITGYFKHKAGIESPLSLQAQPNLSV